MNLRLLLLLVLTMCLLLGCRKTPIGPTATCSPEFSFALNSDHPKRAAIEAILDEYIARGIPGANVLISDNDGYWVVSRGYADLEQGIDMTPCHICKLGSVTKMMMGTLAWQYIQQGEISLDDPISLYLPEVTEALPYGEAITLGMLINHTSGIYDIAADLAYNLAIVNDLAYGWTSEEIVAYVEGKPATHEPGTALRYSNTNTMLLGMILDVAIGRPHGELLQEQIFDRLGMENTVYYDHQDAFPFDNIAQGYTDFHNDGGSIQNISQMNPGSGNGFTGVYSTVSDLYLFIDALLREQTLTSPENLGFILTNIRTREDQNWGSCCGGIHQEHLDIMEEFPGAVALGHAGGDVGYAANLNYFPHNNTIFAATYNYGTLLRSPLRDVQRDMSRELVALMAEE